MNFNNPIEIIKIIITTIIIVIIIIIIIIILLLLVKRQKYILSPVTSVFKKFYI